jgi:hypothetical protein
MLGEKLGEERGQMTGMRVLPLGPHGPRVEVSFQASGTILGQVGTDVGTYISTARPDGTMMGEGQGVVMTGEGDMANWTATGVGKFTGKGTAINWRGALFYQTTSPRLAQLNGTAVVFEFDVDENGKTEARIWEWK